MRILILDDNRAYGELLASACKKLGHTSVVTESPGDAMGRLAGDTLDAVLVDLEMPEMNGTVFTSIARDQGITLPIAICTGNSMDEELTRKARQLGQVLPKIWTHADLREVLRALQLEGRAKAMSAEQLSGPTLDHIDDAGQTRDDFGEDTFNDYEPPEAVQQLARGTGATPQSSLLDEDISSAPFPQTSFPSGIHETLQNARRKTTNSQVRRAAPRVHVRCTMWEQIRQLCMDVIDGRTAITIHAQANLSMGQTVILALALPDEMVVSIEAIVAACGSATDDGQRPYQIELIGFGSDETSFLLERCDESIETAPSDTKPIQARPRAQVPLAPSAPNDIQPKIPDSVDSVDIPLDDPYAPKISWD